MISPPPYRHEVYGQPLSLFENWILFRNEEFYWTRYWTCLQVHVCCCCYHFCIPKTQTFGLFLFIANMWAKNDGNLVYWLIISPKRWGVDLLHKKNTGFCPYLSFFFKMPIHKNGLKWPHVASRTSGTSHSISLFPKLNLRMKRKSFRNFTLIESGLVSEKKIENFYLFFFRFFSETSPDSMSLKFRNDFFSIFKLSSGNKSIECDVPEVLEATCGHFKLFFVCIGFFSKNAIYGQNPAFF